MRVIIAYDGSTYADAAIDDLRRAGLPHDSEILVVSVADLSTGRPTISEFDLISAASRRTDIILEQVRNYEAQVLMETRRMTSDLVDRLRDQFPEWKLHSEVLTGEPAAELLSKVDEWNADLILGGSQGRSTIGRLFLGSVSKTVAEESAASVRVVRRGFEKPADAPIEILLGAEHPAEAERLAEVLSRREWPVDTRMRLVAVDDGVAAGTVTAIYPDGKSIYQSVAERLAGKGIKVSVQIQSGDPQTVLLEAAEAWRADAIFVVARKTGSRGLDRTAAGLVTNAKCTVEIIR